MSRFFLAWFGWDYTANKGVWVCKCLPISTYRGMRKNNNWAVGWKESWRRRTCHATKSRSQKCLPLLFLLVVAVVVFWVFFFFFFFWCVCVCAFCVCVVFFLSSRNNYAIHIISQVTSHSFTCLLFSTLIYWSNHLLVMHPFIHLSISLWYSRSVNQRNWKCWFRRHNS